MFNLLQNASDDQTALGACLLTLAGAAFIVFASYHLGPAGQRQRNQNQSNTTSGLQKRSRIETRESHERAA